MPVITIHTLLYGYESLMSLQNKQTNCILTMMNMMLHRLQFGHEHTSPLLRCYPVTSVGALPMIGGVEPVDLQWHGQMSMHHTL